MDPEQQPPQSTQTPPENAPQNPTLPKKPFSKKKIVIIVLGILFFLFLGLPISGYILFQTKDPLSKWIGNESNIKTTPPVTNTISPTPDPTADWKTYVASNSSYTIQYPSSFIWFLCPEEILVLQPRIEGNKNLHGTTLETCSGDSYFDMEIRKEQTPEPIPITNESYQYVSEDITLADLPAIKYTATIAPTCYGYCAIWKERIEIENKGSYYY